MAMKFFAVLSLVFLVVLQSCNTLHNTKIINIQILVPGEAKVPADYKRAVIRYNNANISSNPFSSAYYEDIGVLTETDNIDSIASEIYFQKFAATLKEQKSFDTIIELPSFDFTGIALNDTLVAQMILRNDSSQVELTSALNKNVVKFVVINDYYFSTDSGKSAVHIIDPEFGLYTKQEIQQIADSTGADIFLSLDFFAAVDGIYSSLYLGERPISTFPDQLYEPGISREIVYVLAFWNVYDLRKTELCQPLNEIDTIQWFERAYKLEKAKKLLPPRRDAVLNAADISASRFAECLLPHWIDVKRMYYQSGQVEMAKTDKLVEENRWMEAAEIWRKNTNNKNKKIAAKSMFNMALACEMNGEIAAALDWAIKSFYVYGNKNDAHFFNTREYINILGQRKLDIKNIENR